MLLQMLHVTFPHMIYALAAFNERHSRQAKLAFNLLGLADGWDYMRTIQCNSVSYTAVMSMSYYTYRLNLCQIC